MIFDVVLLLATVLCGLVAGLLFSFSVIVMPGIGRLEDRDFIRAFQEIDGVIQRGQPLFGLIWLGSVMALLASMVLGFWQVAATERILLACATGMYLFGVQLPTFTVNIPLNNALQSVDVDAEGVGPFGPARQSFETRWNRWNTFRTGVAVLTMAILVILVSRV